MSIVLKLYSLVAVNNHVDHNNNYDAKNYEVQVMFQNLSDEHHHNEYPHQCQ